MDRLPQGPLSGFLANPDVSTEMRAFFAARGIQPSGEAPQIDEPQGEAIGFAANGASYFTMSEGVGAAVHRFTVLPPLRG
jgi:hypothetical protein